MILLKTKYRRRNITSILLKKKYHRRNIVTLHSVQNLNSTNCLLNCSIDWLISGSFRFGTKLAGGEMLRQCLLFYCVLTLVNSVIALDIFIGPSFSTNIEEQTDHSLHNNNYTLGSHGLLSSWSCNVENNIVCLCHVGTSHFTFLR